MDCTGLLNVLLIGMGRLRYTKDSVKTLYTAELYEEEGYGKEREGIGFN